MDKKEKRIFKKRKFLLKCLVGENTVYVDCNKKLCQNQENAKQFDTVEEAIEEIETLPKEWQSLLIIDIFDFGYTIDELDENYIATDNFDIYVVRRSENRKKYYRYLMPFVNWAISEQQEDVFIASDIAEKSEK